MKKSPLFIVLIFVASLLLSGCGAPSPVRKQNLNDDGGNVSSHVKLSKERVAEIRKAFIGRTFVFKEDWYEYYVIDSDPLGGLSDPAPITKFANWVEKRNYRVKAAAAGMVAKITGIKMYRDGFTFICDVEGADKAYLIIINHRPWTLPFGSRNTSRSVERDALKDKRITVDWIDRNLTYHTVEWLDNVPDVPDVELALPEPPVQPSLTPLPMTGGSQAMVPIIGRLQVQAEPPVVRNNQTLNLLLDYSVEGANQAPVAVRETRSLLLDGQVLPGYPKQTNEARLSGQYSSNYQQVIPPQAKAGSYVYEGELYIAADCVSRTKAFSVSP